jgi:hypothetical protein
MTLSATKIIVDRLEATPAITAIVGTRIYAVRAAQGSLALPHVVVRQIGGTPDFALDGLASQESRLLVSAMATTFAVAEQAALAIAAALDFAAFTVDGVPIHVARGSDDIADYLDKPALFRRAVVYEVRT